MIPTRICTVPRKRKKRHYVRGIGHMNWKKERYYLNNFLSRETINYKEYKRLKRVLVKLNIQKDMVQNRISIVEKILLKFNSPCV